MEVIRSSESSIDFQRTTQRYIPEDSTVQCEEVPTVLPESGSLNTATESHACPKTQPSQPITAVKVETTLNL
jgi:hypothetical protein